MTEKTFPLERFYYGVLKGQTQSKPTVLARTSGIAPEHIKECLLVGRLAPPTVDQVSDKMAASLGIFRGEKLDYILTVAQINAAGVPQLLFVVLPRGPMSWLAGNLQPFRSLGNLEMPVFAGVRENLTPFILKDPKTATSSQQSKVMSNLLFYCNDNMTVAEGVLTAVVRGQPVAIKNAPNSLEKRLNFIEGLMSLLPPPARMRITFATNVLRVEDSLAEIKFLVNDETPADHTTFDWEKGTITPETFERHDYAKFILAQLRLDPIRVIEHASALSRTTAWRGMRNDNLEDALAWAAQRARIDSTVLSGQPADRDRVADILRQDPTLSNELRVAYAKHLLAMTLALKEWEPADILPGIAAANRDVAEALFAQLRDAINGKQQKEALDLVERWMRTVPEAPALPWHQLWHLASWLELQKRLEAKDFQSSAEYIRGLADKEPIFKVEMVASQIILQTLKYAYQSSELAQALLILAATQVSIADFQQLANDERLARQFPPALQRSLSVLREDIHSTGQRHPEVLIKGVEVLPSQYRPAVLAKLVEIALYLRRSELIDSAVLGQILQLAQSQYHERYRPLIHYILEDFADFARVKKLQPHGWVLLPQLYFMGGYIEEGNRLIELYQGNMFAPNQKADYLKLVNEIFSKSLLQHQTIINALEGFEDSRIWPDARVRAFSGALENQNWNANMEPAARRLTTLLFNTGELTRSVSPEEMLRLLQFHGERNNPLDMIRTASALVDKAIIMGDQGPQLLTKAWHQLAWQPEVGQAAVELLRRYMRQVNPALATGLPEYFRKELGKNVGDALQASYLVRNVIGRDNLVDFANDLVLTVKLLYDIALPYSEKKDRPPMHRVKHDLDTMSGNVTEEERQQIAKQMVEIGDTIYELGAAADGRRRPNASWDRNKILETMPENVVEFMLWLGSYFAEKKLPSVDFDKDTPAHILGNRSINMFKDEIATAHTILMNLKFAFADPIETVSVDALKEEAQSLWDDLSLYNQREYREPLTEAAWQLAFLLAYMAGRGNDRIFKDKGHGKKLEAGREEPTTELEAMRWMSGYFARKHE
ncbi:MAG: hypothetical protein L0154_27525 [Chloroflexi bacterium]|nr:hypothetical protein [Chloroflexota bacterium]